MEHLDDHIRQISRRICSTIRYHFAIYASIVGQPADALQKLEIAQTLVRLEALVVALINHCLL